MAKNKKNNQQKKQIMTTTNLLATYCKRYGIILLISAPIILIFNFIMSREVSWYNETLSIVVTFFLLLLACFIGLIVFNKIDDKREREDTSEKHRDPFAD